MAFNYCDKVVPLDLGDEAVEQVSLLGKRMLISYFNFAVCYRAPPPPFGYKQCPLLSGELEYGIGHQVTLVFLTH